MRGSKGGERGREEREEEGRTKLTTRSFIVVATLAKVATALERLLRLTNTAFESVMNCPRRGVHCNSFLAIILHPLGKIRPRSV